MQINAYSSTSRTSSTDGTYGMKSNEGLDMQDFLNLLMAQMTNQDPMNPMDNTEFISQMAQFSSLQAMSDLRETTLQGQASNFIGKNVVVADYDSKGKFIIDEGVVQRVTFYNGSVGVYVNGKEYGYGNIMEVKEVKNTEETPPVEKPPEDDSNDEGSKTEED